MNITFPKTKRDLKIQLSRDKPSVPKPVIDLQLLRKDREILKTFTDYLDTALNNTEDQDMNEINETIVSSIKRGLEEYCPKLVSLKKKEPWEDKILQQKVKELRKMTTFKEARVLQK